jgi:dTDP-4-amino-4,6-dideoxygalactose transaminase
MRVIQASYPVQSRWRFLRRVVKYAGIKLIDRPRVFGLLATTCRRLGKTHDAVISGALRGFPGPAFFTKIREQPSYPLLALLSRRLRTFDAHQIERRTAIAQQAIRSMPAVSRPGAAAGAHSYWVFPITTDSPGMLMRRLWAHGFDATRGASSLGVVDPPPDRPELAPEAASRAMADLLYLPVYPGVSTGDLDRLTALVNTFESTSWENGPVEPPEPHREHPGVFASAQPIER